MWRFEGRLGFSLKWAGWLGGSAASVSHPTPPQNSRLPGHAGLVAKAKKEERSSTTRGLLRPSI